MKITEITLHNQDGIQKPILNIEWYSKQFVCYKYNNTLEIGLWDNCIALDSEGGFINPKEVGKSELINFNEEITEIVPPEHLDSFIGKFMEGMINAKN